MKANKLIIRINKPASEVFSFYINPQNTSLWIDSIVVEQTSEWPIKIGTVYKNQNKAGDWSEYLVTGLKENVLFELASKNGNYHVRYTHKNINDNSSELVYYEWVNRGEIEDPFTQEILQKLKKILETQKD